ncbi:MAG: hypothetical protein RL172_2098 [Bacteroidota bacterium]
MGLLISSIVFSQPIANFTSDKVAGCAPLTVQFQDASSGAPTSWSWDLGNTTQSGFSNPVTTYITPGTYTISLKVSNLAGSDSITKTQYITVYEKPVVNFFIADTSGCVPHATLFTDASTTSFGTITNWEWDFDDGSPSQTTSAVNHTFTKAGNFNITLTVINSGGCINSISKAQAVIVSDSIIANFAFSKSVLCNPPEAIRFTNLTSGPGTFTYQWNFGDGSPISTLKDPVHTYLAGDSFTVSLTATNESGCSNTLVLTDSLVLNNTKPFISGPDTVCINTTTKFTNTSNPFPLNYDWTFSDGLAISDTPAVRVWSVTGNYSVKLVNTFLNCKDSTTKNITVINRPIISIRANDSASCRVPFAVNFTDNTPRVVDWTWDFGDGSPSINSGTPLHTYTTYPASGAYSVRLSVKDANGCTNNKLFTDFIKIQRPQIAIDTKEGGGCVPYIFRPIANINSAETITSYLWDFGDGSTSTNRLPVHTYNVLGNYDIKLKITTADGCEDSLTITQGVKIGTRPIVDFSILNPLECAATNVQFTDLSAPADRWLWSFGDDSTSTDQNAAHRYFDTGRFTIKLIAWNNGCSDSAIKTNAVTIKPAVPAFTPIYSCTNKRQVTFSDSSLGATSWLWNFGDGATSAAASPVHTYSAIGTYPVSLTVINGTCSSTLTQTISLVNVVPDFNPSTDSICARGIISFLATGMDTTKIIRYIWNYGDGKIDTTLTGNTQHRYDSAGTFSVTLTVQDINNCQPSTTKSNIIHIFSPKANFIVSATTGCLKANTALVFTDAATTADGNDNIRRRVWTFGDGTSQIFIGAAPSSVSHVYTKLGVYYPRFQVVDSVGCFNTYISSTPITVSQPLADFDVSHTTTCNNDTLFFDNNSLGDGLTYNWNFGDASASTDSLPAKFYTTNGLYDITLIVTDSFGCRDTLLKPGLIDVKEVVAAFTPSDTFGSCTPFFVDFNNTCQNEVTRLWDYGDGGFSGTASPRHPYTASGIYQVTLTSKRSEGCISTATRTIEVNAPTAAIRFSPVEGCAPLVTNFVISTRNELSYSWDFDDGSVAITADSTISHTYLFPGKYIPRLLIKDSFGCIIPIYGVDTISLYSSSVNFGVNSQLFCDGGLAVFSDSTISGSAVSSYFWDFGDGSTASTQNPSHAYTATGVYDVKLVITTVFGCTDSLIKPAYIRVAQKPQIGITGDTVHCGPSSVVFNGVLISADTAAINWQWNFGNGNTSAQQNPPSQNYPSAATYPVSLIATSNNGCRDTAFTNVLIHPIPIVFAGNDTVICLNSTAQLQASGADSYSWQPAVALSCTNCSNPVTATTDSVTYYVTGTTLFGCTNTDAVWVDVKKPFTVTGLQAQDSVCQGNVLNLSVSGAENYFWTPATGLSNNNTASVIASPAVNTVYTVVGYDDKNCFTDSAQISINVNANPTVTASPGATIQLGASIQLSTQSSNDVVTWLWQPAATLSCSNCPSPIATPEQNTRYSITVTNQSRCTDSAQVYIQVVCDNSNLYLPSAFTPNGDGLNDYFYPMGVGIFKVQNLKIFNRYGQLVFQKENVNANDPSTGWDGRYKGILANPGTYIYTVEVICKNSEKITTKGKILLLQ